MVVGSLPEEYALEIHISGSGQVDVILLDDRDEERDDGLGNNDETATQAVFRLLKYADQLKDELQLRRVSK